MWVLVGRGGVVIGDDSVPVVPGFSDLVEIGRGGFGVVFAASDVTLGRRAALKVVDVGVAGARRALREARALGGLSEIPNVVDVYQLSETTDGRPVLVMRLMDGSLAGEIQVRGALPLELVVGWASQVGVALDAAHARGIFHRDVKPENVLLSASGDAFLADFGIAALDGVASNTTTINSFSPPYAPPELLVGEVLDPGAADRYSLAATCFAAVTGDAPFGTASDGGVAGLLHRIVTSEVPEHVRLSPELRGVFERGMAKDPGARFGSAAEFVEELADAVDTAQRTDPVSGSAVSEPSVLPIRVAPQIPPGSLAPVADDDVTRVQPADSEPSGTVQALRTEVERSAVDGASDGDAVSSGGGATAGASGEGRLKRRLKLAFVLLLASPIVIFPVVAVWNSQSGSDEVGFDSDVEQELPPEARVIATLECPGDVTATASTGSTIAVAATGCRDAIFDVQPDGVVREVVPTISSPASLAAAADRLAWVRSVALGDEVSFCVESVSPQFAVTQGPCLTPGVFYAVSLAGDGRSAWVGGGGVLGWTDLTEPDPILREVVGAVPPEASVIDVSVGPDGIYAVLRIGSLLAPESSQLIVVDPLTSVVRRREVLPGPVTDVESAAGKVWVLGAVPGNPAESWLQTAGGDQASTTPGLASLFGGNLAVRGDGSPVVKLGTDDGTVLIAGLPSESTSTRISFPGAFYLGPLAPFAPESSLVVTSRRSVMGVPEILEVRVDG